MEVTCPHKDIRNFEGARCCLSCGFALFDEDLLQRRRSGARHVDEQDARITLQPYIYKRLNYELERDIRLILLRPGLQDEDLRCTVSHHSLSDPPNYAAVSYTWACEDGSTNMSKRILCQNNTFIAISENCDRVLRSIRASGSITMLWIDMVCIDQKNVDERNHQVGLMDDVYSQAQLVTVDLGHSTPYSDILFDAVNGMLFDSLDIEEATTRLLRRRWFKRIWVLQEISLARHAVVRCGLKLATWHSLKAFFHRLVARSALPPAMTMEVARDKLMCMPELLDALLQTHSCQAKDPRDRIFALLGLCRKEVRSAIPVDYTVALEKLHHQITIACLRSECYNSSVLLQRGIRFSLRDSNHSWSPNWTAPSLTRPLPSAYSVFQGIRKIPDPTTPQSLPIEQKNNMLTQGLLESSGRFLGEVLFVIMTKGQDDCVYQLPSVSPFEIIRGDTDSIPISIEAYINLVRRAALRPWDFPDLLPSVYVDHSFSELRDEMQDEILTSRGSTVDGFVAASSELRNGRVLFGTRSHLGYGPMGLRAGDSIWALHGQRTCSALSKRHDSQRNIVDERIGLAWSVDGQKLGRPLEWNVLERSDCVSHLGGNFEILTDGWEEQVRYQGSYLQNWTPHGLDEVVSDNFMTNLEDYQLPSLATDLRSSIPRYRIIGECYYSVSGSKLMASLMRRPLDRIALV